MHLALTQPDACGAGESLGDVEIGSSGGAAKNTKVAKYVLKSARLGKWDEI